MVGQPVDVSMPPDMAVPGGYTIRFTAIDPSTGETVAGVVISNASIQAGIDLGVASTLDSGPFMFVPGPGA